MREYGFSVALIFPYNDIIFDSVLIQENSGGKNLYSGKFYAEF